MSDVTALEKHNCAACGAQATWNPKKKALICEFCGTVAPAELDLETGKIREIDLVRTLREMPEELRGWKAAKKTVRCRSCRAISVFDAARVGQNCDFCGSAELIDYDEIKSPLRPQSILPFMIDHTRVRERIRDWYKSRWFAPNRLKSKAMTDTVNGVYLPYWTFDARAECPWTAESGTYYYTTQTYRDSQGKSRTRRVRHVRWRPASGHVSHFFDDEPIPGTRGVDAKLLRAIEPFPTGDLVPYDTAFLSGFVVEHYQVVLFDAAQQAEKSMDQQLYRLCASEVPGDTFRNLRIDPSYGEQTFKHMLVPVWILAYRFGKRRFQVLVNGYTGTIAGKYPKSFWKIFFLVSFLVVAGVTVALLLR